MYHHEVLSRCPGCGRGQLEKSDHDCYDFFESWDWYEWFLIDHPDMESLHEVVIRSRLDPGEASVAQLAASASALALRSWSGGAVLPRFADRSTVNKHVTPIRIRWDGDQPLFESEEKVP